MDPSPIPMSTANGTVKHMPRNVARYLLNSRPAETNVRLLTSPIRALPDFMVIGVQRGGSTSLFRYLCQFSNILGSQRKELYFFSRRFHKGLYWYRSHFPTLLEKWRKKALVFEATADYIFYPGAPERIADTFPNGKFIALLRNPADRAFAQYQRNMSASCEPLSFAEAVEAEPERLEPALKKLQENPDQYIHDVQQYSYLYRGHYADQLSRWFKLFDRQQILVIQSEAFFENPADKIRKIMRFLEIDYAERELETIEFKPYMSRRHVTDPIKDAVRQRLVAYFEPHNRDLYDLLGEDYGWN